MIIESNDSKIEYFSLLHVNLDASQSPNLKGSTLSGIQKYIRCAILLARSLRRNNCNLVLYTNNREFLLELEPSLECHLKIDILKSEIDIPTNIRFYSAHQKIAAFDTLSRKTEFNFGVFLDLDCVVFNLSFLKNLNNCNYKFFNIYDDQECSYGNEVISKTIENIVQAKNYQRIWIGGEFLYASRTYLRQISDQCKNNLSAYLGAIDSLHHVGDEALLTASFVSSGLVFDDINSSARNVGRLWSVRINYSDRGLLELKANIIHFPADKNFLAILSYLPFNPVFFKILYVPYFLCRKSLSYVRYYLSSFV